jgi:transposase
MKRAVLRDDQWEHIKDFLPGKAGDYGVIAVNNRLFIEAVLWIARTGSLRRDLPECFGHWHRVTVRYNRWSHKDAWANILTAVSDDPDLEWQYGQVPSAWGSKKTAAGTGDE